MTDLNATLQEIERYCDDVALRLHPRLKWRCYGNLRIHVKGGEFKIESEHGHPKPITAAQEMLERVQTCMRDIHKMSAVTPLNAPTRALEAAK